MPYGYDPINTDPLGSFHRGREERRRYDIQGQQQQINEQVITRNEQINRMGTLEADELERKAKGNEAKRVALKSGDPRIRKAWEDEYPDMARDQRILEAEETKSQIDATVDRFKAMEEIHRGVNDPADLEALKEQLGPDAGVLDSVEDVRAFQDKAPELMELYEKESAANQYKLDNPGNALAAKRYEMAKRNKDRFIQDEQDQDEITRLEIEQARANLALTGAETAAKGRQGGLKGAIPSNVTSDDRKEVADIIRGLDFEGFNFEDLGDEKLPNEDFTIQQNQLITLVAERARQLQATVKLQGPSTMVPTGVLGLEDAVKISYNQMFLEGMLVPESSESRGTFLGIELPDKAIPPSLSIKGGPRPSAPTTPTEATGENEIPWDEL